MFAFECKCLTWELSNGSLTVHFALDSDLMPFLVEKKKLRKLRFEFLNNKRSLPRDPVPHSSLPYVHLVGIKKNLIPRFVKHRAESFTVSTVSYAS